MADGEAACVAGAGSPEAGVVTPAGVAPASGSVAGSVVGFGIGAAEPDVGDADGMAWASADLAAAA